MSSYVYLIRNGDLYKIGIANNLQREITLLKPDEIIKTIEVAHPKSLEARLFRRYKANRVPDSNYFRLSKDQLNDCKNQLGEAGELPKSLSDEVSIGLNGSLFLIIITFFSSLYIGRGFFTSFAFAMSLGSIPMWSIFILGNFGGYDVDDLPLFSSWVNRLKAFLLALFITAIAFTIYFFIN